MVMFCYTIHYSDKPKDIKITQLNKRVYMTIEIALQNKEISEEI